MPGGTQQRSGYAGRPASMPLTARGASLPCNFSANLSRLHRYETDTVFRIRPSSFRLEIGPPAAVSYDAC